MSVYFLRVGSDGAIKVGVSTNLDRRIATLQTAHPDKLHLLFHYAPGSAPLLPAHAFPHPLGQDAADREAEVFHHDLFAEYHIRGEWFLPDPFVLTHINALRECVS